MICEAKNAHLYDEGVHECLLEAAHEGDHECECGERWIQYPGDTLVEEEAPNGEL